MPDVKFTIASRPYKLRCATGQEQHLLSVAEAVDARLRPLADAAPAADDRQLLVMVAVALMDDLSTATASRPADGEAADDDSLRAMAEALQAECAALRAENAALRLWAGRMGERLTALSGSLGALADAPAAD